MYRIKQNSANHGTYSAFIKTESLCLYHYAGNNPVTHTDIDGKEIHELTDAQWDVVKISLDEAIRDLQVIVEQLSDFSTEGGMIK